MSTFLLAVDKNIDYLIFNLFLKVGFLLSWAIINEKAGNCSLSINTLLSVFLIICSLSYRLQKWKSNWASSKILNQRWRLKKRSQFFLSQRSIYESIWVQQKILTFLLQLMKRRLCSTNIILSFTKEITVQVKLHYLILLLLLLFLLWFGVAIFFFWSLLSVFFILLFSGSADGGPAIDSSISAAIQNSNKIYLTKNIVFPEQNIKTTIVVTKTENIAKRNNSVM